MQEALKKVAGSSIETGGRAVTLCLRSQTIILHGIWNWEMSSAAVYACDVMSFPEVFEGTKGLIHPDDVSKLTAAISLIEEKELPKLEFRLITTYGEIKQINGQRISIDNKANNLTEPLPGQEPWEEALEQIVRQKEIDFLQLQKELAEYTERLNGVGSRIINKTLARTWYSDNMFRIHGLAPQSLNAHVNTFVQFIHRDDRQTVLDAFEKAYEEELPITIEYRIQLPGDEIRYVQQVTRWMYNYKGETLLCGIIRDVTEERKLADEVLAAQSQSLFYREVLKLFQQRSSAGYWYLNLVTKKSSYSESFYRIYGFKQFSLPVTNSFLHLVHADDRKRVEDAFENMYASKVMPEIEFRIIRSDGKLRHLKQSAALFTSADREEWMIGVVQDITVQRSLEKRIEELSETVALNQLVNQLTEETSEISTITWLPAGLMRWSNGFYQLAGVKQGTEASQKLLYNVIHPNDVNAFKKAEAAALKGEDVSPIEIKLLSKNTTKSVQVSFRILNESAILVAIVHDVTSQTSWREQHEHDTSFTKALEDAVHEVVIFTNNDNTILHWNANAVEKTGIAKEDALHRNLFEVLPSLHNENFHAQLNKTLNGENINVAHAENVYLSKAHDYFLLPLKNENDAVTGVLHIVHDVSRQLELQKQLNERLSFIESLLEASVDQVVVLDRFMNYLYWNKKAAEHYGIAKENVIGKNILEIFPSFRNHPGYSEFRKALKGETVYLPAIINEEIVDYFETYLAPIKDEEGNITAVLWIIHDLRKEYEVQKQKKIAEENLKEQTRYLQRITETTPDMISIVELETRRLSFLNADTFRMHGFDPDKMINILENKLMIHPEDRCILDDYFQSLINAPDDAIFVTEYRAKNSIGDWGWFSVRGKVFQRDERGKPTHALNMIVNITEKKKAEAKANETKDLLQAILDTSLIGICLHEPVYDEQGNVIDFLMRIVNRELEELTGRFDLTGKLYAQEFPGIKRTELFNLMAEAVQSNTPKKIEYPYRHDGFDKTFLSMFSPSGKYLIATNLDITGIKQTEEKLIESRHWLEQMAHASPDAILIYELEKRQPLFLNNCFARWLHISQDELLEMGIEERMQFVHPDDRLKLHHFTTKLAETKRDDMVTLEYRVQTAGDEVLWLRNRSKVFQRDADGNATHVLSILQNVTEEIALRDELKQRTQFAETILDSSTNRITVFDRNYRFIVWNKRCEEIHGVTCDKVIGKTIFEMFPGVEKHPVFIDAQERSLKGEYVHVPFVQDGYTGAYLELFYVPLVNESGETYAVLNIMHDVSKFVKNTEELDALNKKLETKNIELEQKNEEITSFAFVASHDMKEPLRKIHTFSDWLMEEESAQLSEKGKTLVEKINTSVHRMEVLIEDILVLTKIHSDPHKEENVDLNKILKAVAEDMQEQILQTSTAVKADKLPVIRANANQLFYLFKNLMSNAIKFQKPGSIPQLSITSEIVKGSDVNINESKEEYLKLAFTDNGFGFDQKYARKIFQVFQRLHGKHEFEGTGMGLAICRKIMENHNGMINVISEVGKGSVFNCFFPLH